MRMNPVMLKELRQMVRSKLVALGLMLMLGAQFVGTMIVMAANSEKLVATAAQDADVGQVLFVVLTAILQLTLFFGVTGYMVVRVVLERSRGEMDLQYTTTLKARTFVDGKIGASMALVALMASAVLPFMILSYLLRGVDLLVVLFFLTFVVCLEIGFLCLAIFVATLTRSRVWCWLILAGLLAFGVMMMIVFGNVITDDFLGLDSVNWQLLWLSLGALVMLCLMCRAGALAAFSAPQSNYDLPQRVWWTACCVLSGVVAGWLSIAQKDASYMGIWSMLMTVVVVFSFLRAISQPNEYSARVRLSIAKNPVARFCQFSFFTGGINGIVWTLGFATLMGVVWRVALQYESPGEFVLAWRIPVLLFYTTAYCLTARAVWFLFFSRRWRPSLLWLFTILLVVAGSFLPFVWEINMEEGMAERCFGNMAAALTNDDTDVMLFHVTASCMWFACALLATVPEWVAARRLFRPVGKEAGDES